MIDNAERLWTLAETAKYLGLSYGTVKNKVAAGEIPVLRFGGAVRTRKAQIDAWIEEETAKAAAEKAAA